MHPSENSGLATMIIVAVAVFVLGALWISPPGTNDSSGAATLWRVAQRDGPRP